MHSLLINQLGIQQWYPRKLQHPWYNKNKVIVDVRPAIAAARCLVLLPEYAAENLQLAAATNKILTGMLGVLNLSSTEISIGKIYINNSVSCEPVTSRLCDGVSQKQSSSSSISVVDTVKELTSIDWKQALAEVESLQPEFILLLAKPTSAGIVDKRLITSFHPQHLVSNPQDKTQAYQDLLTLKEKLHNNAYLT